MWTPSFPHRSLGRKLVYVSDADAVLFERLQQLLFASSVGWINLEEETSGFVLLFDTRYSILCFCFLCTRGLVIRAIPVIIYAYTVLPVSLHTCNLIYFAGDVIWNHFQLPLLSRVDFPTGRIALAVNVRSSVVSDACTAQRVRLLHFYAFSPPPSAMCFF